MSDKKWRDLKYNFTIGDLEGSIQDLYIANLQPPVSEESRCYEALSVVLNILLVYFDKTEKINDIILKGKNSDSIERELENEKVTQNILKLLGISDYDE